MKNTVQRAKNVCTMILNNDTILNTYSIEKALLLGKYKPQKVY